MSSPAISAGLSHRLRPYFLFFYLFFNNPLSKAEHRVRQLRTALAFDKGKCWKEIWIHKSALSTMSLHYMRHRVTWRWRVFQSHSARRQRVISAPTARKHSRSDAWSFCDLCFYQLLFVFLPMPTFCSDKRDPPLSWIDCGAIHKSWTESFINVVTWEQRSFPKELSYIYPVLNLWDHKSSAAYQICGGGQ